MSHPENDAPDRRKAPFPSSIPDELTIPPMTYGSWMELGLAARQMATAATPPETSTPPRRRRPRPQATNAA